MKRVLAVLALMMIILPVFAGGNQELVAGSVGGVASGAAIGATVGSIVPGIGTTIGAFLGGTAGLISGVLSGAAKDKQRKAQMEQLDLQKEQNYQSAYTSAKDLYDTAYTNYDNSLTAIKQGEANISSYDQAIMRWQDQYDIGLNQLQTQGKTDYMSLMHNFSDVANVQSSKGQSGGSADLVAGSQRSKVISLVGSDLMLDDIGGTYGTAVREFNRDADAEFSQMVDQRQIEIDALNKNIAASNEYATALARADENLKVASNDFFGEDGKGKFDSAGKVAGFSGYDKDTTESKRKLVDDINNGKKNTSGYEADGATDEEIEKIKKKRGLA